MQDVSGLMQQQLTTLVLIQCRQPGYKSAYGAVSGDELIDRREDED